MTRQLAINLTAVGTWTRLVLIESGISYAAPMNGRSIARSLRVLNMGAPTVAVSFAVSNSTSPSDRQIVAHDVNVNAADNALIEGVVVLPAGYSLLARIDSYADYPPLNVTIQASVLEVTV